MNNLIKKSTLFIINGLLAISIAASTLACQDQEITKKESNSNEIVKSDPTGPKPPTP